MGHFCVTDSQTHKLTNGWKVHLTELHVAAKKKFEKIFKGKLSKLIVSYYVLIKKAFFCWTFLRNSQTNSQTDGWKGRLTELHVTAKKRLFL